MWCFNSIVGFVIVVALVMARWRILRRTSGHPWHAFRAARGWGRGVSELARRLDYSPDELRRVEPRYRRVAIPKRRGNGFRKLLVPDDRTKSLQRAILRNVLAPLRAHPAATAFERGKSIVDNALPHAHRAVVIRMDVVDFFGSTGAERVESYFRRVGWNGDAARLLTALTTTDGALPQGAPTSPRLANLVNFRLDVSLSRFAEARNARYTRYADDITISHARDTARRVRGTLQVVRRVLRRYGYSAHGRAKTSIRRRHQRQAVTGLVVNDGVRIPRHVRRRMRAVRHHLATGRPATLTPEQLRGWDAFASMVARESSLES